MHGPADMAAAAAVSLVAEAAVVLHSVAAVEAASAAVAAPLRAPVSEADRALETLPGAPLSPEVVRRLLQGDLLSLDVPRLADDAGPGITGVAVIGTAADIGAAPAMVSEPVWLSVRSVHHITTEAPIITMTVTPMWMPSRP